MPPPNKRKKNATTNGAKAQQVQNAAAVRAAAAAAASSVELHGSSSHASSLMPRPEPSAHATEPSTHAPSQPSQSTQQRSSVHLAASAASAGCTRPRAVEAAIAPRVRAAPSLLAARARARRPALAPTGVEPRARIGAHDVDAGRDGRPVGRGKRRRRRRRVSHARVVLGGRPRRTGMGWGVSGDEAVISRGQG